MQRTMLRKINTIAAASALLGAAPTVLLAGTAGNKLSQLLEDSGINASGYVAGSYFYSNELNALHQFDFNHSDFHLDQAGLTIAYQPKEGFGGLVDVIAGEDARLVNAAESFHSSLGAHAGVFNVKQAFLQYAGGGWTFMAGKFVTLAGAEVIAPTGNTNYSRSLLFFGEPLTHTGVRASYAASDMLTVTFGLNNGWNYTSTSGYSSKTGEVSVSLTPSKAYSLTAQGYFGKDPVFDASRTLIDLVGTWNVSDALSFVVSYDYFKQDFAAGSDAKWHGVAGYVNYKLNDQWRLSTRAEYLDDKDGFYTAINSLPGTALGVKQKIKEVTLTVGYAPVNNFELRLEGRYDNFDNNIVPKYKGGVTDNQFELAVQGLFKF